MKTTNIALALALGLMGACAARSARAQIVSDDFDKPTLNTKLWTWFDPQGDDSYSINGYGTSDVVLSLNVSANENHDAWVPPNQFNVAGILQNAPDQDFEVTAKFETIPGADAGEYGFLVYDPTGTNFLRFNVQGDAQTGLLAYLLIIQGGNGNTMAGGTWGLGVSSLVPPSDGTDNGTAYMRLKRQGNQWTYLLSADGISWETVYQPVTQAWTVAQVGPFVGGQGITYALDYFFNDASPILNEDGQAALPTVVLTAPADATTFAAPTNVVFTAAVTDSDSTVTNVAFYANGGLIGNATASPFSITWTNPGVGLYAVTAQATDKLLAAGSSLPITVLVSGPGTQPISDDFNKPALNTALWTTVDPQSDGVFRTVGAGSGNADLEIVVAAGANHDPWLPNLGLSVIQPAPDTNFEISAKFDTLPNTESQEEGLIVEDSFGDFLRFDVLDDGSSPLKAFVGAIINGAANQVSRTPISDVSSPILGNIGTVYLRVRRLEDRWTYSTSPDGVIWTVQSSFVQTLPVSAVGLLAGNDDPTGNSNPPAFPVLVDYFFNDLAPIALEDGQGPNVPPTVAMTGPVGGTLFTAPASVTLTATAADSDGSVAKVDFYSGTNVVGTATNQPYSFAWNLTKTGIYTVTAAATDNRGAITIATNPITFLVGGSGLLPVSDDFNRPVLNTNLWTWINPLGDCTNYISGYGSTDVVLVVNCPPSASGHDPWTDNTAAQIMQNTPDQDFEVTAKFESIPAQLNQEEGILVVDPTGLNFLRFNIQVQPAGGPLIAFMLIINNGAGSSYYPNWQIPITSLAIPANGSNNGTAFLKLRRQGDTWTFFISPDGVAWETVYQPMQQPWTVAQVGLYVGDGGTGYTAAIDYFFNDLAPIVDEDGQAPIPPTRPTLTLTRSANNIVLSWPTSAVGYGLVYAARLSGSISWSPEPTPIVVVGGQNTVTVPAANGARFYRLTK